MQAPHSLAANSNGSDWLARIFREPLARTFRALSVVAHAEALVDHFNTQHLLGESVPAEMIDALWNPPFYLLGKLTSSHHRADGGSVEGPGQKPLIWFRWHGAKANALHYNVPTPSFGSLPAVIDDFGGLVCVHGAREITCGE